MAWLLVLALLPLDVTAPAPPAGDRDGRGLTLIVYAEGRHVGARILNRGPRRVKLWLGETCSGPTPFEAIVDGTPAPFVAPVACDKNVTRFEWLQPGGEVRVVSMTELLHDEHEHRVEVRYHASKPPLEHDVWRGELASTHVNLTAASLIPMLRVVEAPSAQSHAMVVEIEHVWRGSVQMRFFTGWESVCRIPLDDVLVDGVPAGSLEEMPCDAPARPTGKLLQPGQSFTARRSVRIAAGRHELRARYRVTPSDAHAIERADNVGEWIGTAESAPIVVDAP